MFHINDIVVHPGEGVCRVADIRNEEFQKGNPMQYYALEPLYEGGMTVFLPVDQTRVPLRSIVSAEEADTVMQRAENVDSQWTDDERIRKERFNTILRSGDLVMLARLILDIREQQETRRLNGKKLRSSDEFVLQETTRKVRNEIAAAKHTDPKSICI